MSFMDRFTFETQYPPPVRTQCDIVFSYRNAEIDVRLYASDAPYTFEPTETASSSHSPIRNSDVDENDIVTLLSQAIDEADLSDIEQQLNNLTTQSDLDEVTNEKLEDDEEPKND
jgi:hypothetical protein